MDARREWPLRERDWRAAANKSCSLCMLWCVRRLFGCDWLCVRVCLCLAAAHLGGSNNNAAVCLIQLQQPPLSVHLTQFLFLPPPLILPNFLPSIHCFANSTCPLFLPPLSLTSFNPFPLFPAFLMNALYLIPLSSFFLCLTFSLSAQHFWEVYFRLFQKCPVSFLLLIPPVLGS